LSRPARLSRAVQRALRYIPEDGLLDESAFAVTLILKGFSSCDRLTVSDEREAESSICAPGLGDMLLVRIDVECKVV